MRITNQFIALPEPRCETVTLIRPLVNVIVGNLLGLAPYVAIIGAAALIAAAVIVAVSSRARGTILRNLGAQVALGLVLVLVLGGVGLLISSPCGT